MLAVMAYLPGLRGSFAIDFTTPTLVNNGAIANHDLS